jgi:hypothetical protein
MSHQFSTELGRFRTEEAIARADRYRLAHNVRREESGRASSSPSGSFSFRRALAAVTLSCLMGICLATVALAIPARPGGHGDGVTASTGKHNNPGQPVRSQHAYSPETRYGPNVDAIADSRALNEPSASPLPIHIVAQLRAMDSSVSSAKIDAISQLRAPKRIDSVAQLRAMNEPFSTTNVPDLQASERSETNFPLVQSVAIITGILVLIAGALMVVARNQQSPRTV